MTHLRRSRRPRRRPTHGFTLPEVIVTITLIAILASVIVPTIISQVRKGDPARIGSDFLAIRGGSEQFLTDVRRYPASVAELGTAITTSLRPLPGTTTTAFDAADVQHWRGPYLSKDGTAALSTALGLTMKSAFDTVTLGVSGTASAAGGQKYMVLAVPMMNGTTIANDSLTILQLDQQFDDGVLLTGNIRYRKVGGGADTLKFLVMPIY